MKSNRFMLLATTAAALTAAPAVFAETMFEGARPNSFWWPDQLDLSQLHEHDPRSNPYGEDFDYAEAFSRLDLDAVTADIAKVLTDSQDWWPADWGHYGGLMIRMAWHSAGTYRIWDGRGGADGGQQRFEPLNSWPDNVNLDKARRLLWPVKQKYGRNLSWADLMILAGNVSLETMGFKTLGFAGGRTDDWAPDLVYWGAESKMLANNKRYETSDGELERPLAAVQMGLIYVNPEGPNANHDPISAAQDIRQSFYRMAMNDEEIVALIAGGHTLGKVHGARKAKCVGPEPAAASIEEQGFGWKNSCGKGNAEDTMSSGLEGAWTQTPTAWSILYLANLFNFDWQQHKSPGGGTVWIPTDESAHTSVPDAHVEGKRNPPIMLTTDLSLKMDPGFNKISKRFLENPKEFDAAFARAWFKLTHRDLGPRARYLGSLVPEESFIWQDPVPEGRSLSDREVRKIKAKILKSDLTVPQLVRAAWASASTYRATDMRGGANGARVRLAPQKDWEANDPAELAKVLATLEDIQKGLKKPVSMADLIVLGGVAAIEKAAGDAGMKLSIPVSTGRGDATAAMTDAASFDALKPSADAFRNYYSRSAYGTPTQMLVEKADLLGLSVPEMTALIGGMRVLGATKGGSLHGVLTAKPGVLSNDFFVNLLDMSTQWQPGKVAGIYEGLDRQSGALKWTATPVDLIFGSNSELRAVAEVYASRDGEQLFAEDFARAWAKVMDADRFDL